MYAIVQTAEYPFLSSCSVCLVAGLVAYPPWLVITPYHLLLWGPIMSNKLLGVNPVLGTNDKKDEKTRERGDPLYICK